ncbi:hypothetical protein BpHYR1_005488 [Brachionus plicatilis]|uniref:Uncharacterized protein n=1 Tax=Brachionus plicatilis TaxID=10195 RepID=A0A3M7PF12_BRAPC|nr:hypothetical protein BpHYR1_005488 [Brachionus plicatilis]
MVGPVANGKGGAQVHLPFGLQSKDQPDEKQDYGVHDLVYYGHHEHMVFVDIKVNDQVIGKWQFECTDDNQLQCGHQMGTIVETSVLFAAHVHGRVQKF